MTPILFLINECSKLFCSELLKENEKKWKLEHEMEVTGCVISGYLLVTYIGDVFGDIGILNFDDS